MVQKPGLNRLKETREENRLGADCIVRTTFDRLGGLDILTKCPSGSSTARAGSSRWPMTCPSKNST
jgi:hypothetical protein